MNGMPPNRALYDEDGQVYDIVAGQFLVVGLTEDNFGSLTEEQIKKFSDRFHSPEGFMRIGNQILVFPIDEPIKKESVMDKLKNQPTVPKKDPIVKKHKEEVR